MFTAILRAYHRFRKVFIFVVGQMFANLFLGVSAFALAQPLQ
jgi:hypothetical protein